MVSRMDLIDAMVSRDVEAMDMKDLIRLAYEVFEDRFGSYSDEELREHATEFYGELLEELDVSVTQINKANCKVLRKDINEVLEVILSKHGLVGSIGRITFEPGIELRTKLTVTQADPAVKNTQKPAVGQVWVFGGKKYTITSTIGEILASRTVRGLPRTYRIPAKMLSVGTRVK